MPNSIVHRDRHYIDGAWVIPKSTYELLSPTTQSQYSNSPMGDATDIDAAVKAARAALKSWSRVPVAERAEIVLRMAAWLKEAYGEAGKPTPLKNMICEAVGKPLPESDIEVIESATFVEYFCKVASDALSPMNIDLPTELWPTKRSVLVREPVGVVAIIKPLNYPLEMIVWSLIPALLAGNTVVIKPSEKSSSIGLLFGDIATSCGLPAGVLNVVAGDSGTGRALVAHPAVNLVSFTGSVNAGREVAVTCAQSFKRTTLELGGNDAAIVMPDADIELATNGIVWGAFCNAGQVCVGVKRAYVHRSLVDPVVKLLVEKARALRLGVDVGPIIDSSQLEKVIDAVEDAKRDGAHILCGGRRGSSGGYYFEPTVLIDVTENMRLVKDECFGPVLPVIPFDDEGEVIESVNRSKYGLGASVWSSNHSAAMGVATKIDAGMVWINDVNVAYSEAPWGGRKNSGHGFELSPSALSEYSVIKHINWDTSDDKRRFWWYPYDTQMP